MVQKRCLYAFDLDGTLLSCSSVFSFYRYALIKGFFSIRSFFSVISKFIVFFVNGDVEALHKKIFKTLIYGKNKEALHNIALDFVSQWNIKKYVNNRVLTCMEKARSSGHRIVIMTASPDFLINLITPIFNVDRVYSSTYIYDNNSACSDINLMLNGSYKAFLIRNERAEHDFESVWCFSDSSDDLPWLQSADVPVVVNPDRDLKRIAKTNHWTCL